MRQVQAADNSSKKVLDKMYAMKRTSYLCELEYKMVLALNYTQYPTNEGSSFMISIIQYLENFYDRYDVISDLKPYIKILTYTEIDVLRNLIRGKLETEELAYSNNTEKPPSIKMIRLRMIDFKLNKMTGSFINLEAHEKLKLVNTIVQTYLWAFGNPSYLTDNDK